MIPRRIRTLTLLGALLALGAGPASAEGPGARRPRDYPAYALLVGSQRAGEGQQELRFARADAERLAAVLTEIGGLDAAHIQRLDDPGVDELTAALDDLAGRLAAHAARDERTLVLFYYSGHARASGLNLGPDELALGDLKRKLEALPATARVVILDACQSGAISQVKGAEPAQAFSHNSVAGLNTAGLAVLASSSGSELSQESATIGGSYFTHHLVSGLRGAADADGDGRVTLSEAYRHAYHRTLAATAATAVGKQHVTLETDLRGKGEMVLTYPAAASAGLALPDALVGDVLVLREPARTVVAEVYKAAGSAVRLALPPGEYGALVRREADAELCPVTLEAERTTTLAAGGEECETVEIEEVLPKHAAEVEATSTWAVELAFGGFLGRGDGYIDRLGDFGYDETHGELYLHYRATVLYHLNRYLGAGLTFSSLDHREYEQVIRNLGGVQESQHFDWWGFRLGLEVRGSLPLVEDWCTPYLQAGGGLTIGRTEFTDEDDATTTEMHYGYHIGAALGIQSMVWRHIGIFTQAEYLFAPTIENSIGDTHDSGGFAVVLGIRGAL